MPGSAATASAAAAGARARLTTALLKRGRARRKRWALFLCGCGFARFAGRGEQRRAQRFNVVGLKLLAVGSCQIEDVDGPLSIGRDMGGVDDVPAAVDRSRKARQKRRTIAGVDLHDRCPGRSTLGD